MTLDRVTELNILLFMQLVGRPVGEAASEIGWQSERFQNWLSWRDGRIYLSQCMALAECDDSLLLRALAHWQVAYFCGIPQRFFQLRSGLAISCCPGNDSTAESWLRLYRRQRAFLEWLCQSR